MISAPLKERLVERVLPEWSGAKNILHMVYPTHSGAGVWGSPTVDAKKRAIYVAAGDSYSDPPVIASAYLARGGGPGGGPAVVDRAKELVRLMSVHGPTTLVMDATGVGLEAAHRAACATDKSYAR